MQALIALTGVASVWLLIDGGPRAVRVASVIGLAGQPFWLYETYHAGQAGMFMVSMVFCVVWVRGLRKVGG